MDSMDRFWQDAVSILETAERAGESGELNLLIGEDGVLRIVSEPGWRPEALAAHYGARAVYQVKHTAEGVRVEGQAGGRSCVLRGYNQPVCAASSSSCLLPPRLLSRRSDRSMSTPCWS